MVNFIRLLEDNQKRVNLLLKHYICNFSNQETTLIKAMHYNILLGGKRIRPFLVYQIGRLFGVELTVLDVPAVAIECIHIYSLIHDDLPMMDNELLRRGLPSCHVKFNETTAILAGDAFQSLAFNILSNSKILGISLKNRLKMISILSSAIGADGMCLGQLLDLSMEKKKISTIKLEKIYQYKTGKLIFAAVKMGILSSDNCNNQIINYLNCFSTAIGLAFQIQDDIIDVTDDYKTTNENRKKDKKNNYLSIFGFNVARKKIKNLYEESIIYLEHISALGYDTTILVDLVHYIIERNK